MNMGERIKQRRKAMNMTQDELGEKVGLQKSAISKYERGAFRGIKTPMIKKMADVLECDPVWLMGIEFSVYTEDIKRKTTPLQELNDIAEKLTDDDVRILIDMARRMVK